MAFSIRRHWVAALLVATLITFSQAALSTRPVLPTQRITVAAVGDLLIHLPIVTSAHDPKSGAYDFSGIFTPIAPYLQSPDYVVANLETRLAGPRAGYSGYPCFNTPAEFARDVKDAGIDLLATANNHSMDKGWAGITATLDNLDARGIPHIGTARNAEEQQRLLLVDVKDVRLAFLNYTFGTNGIPLPPGKAFAVNLLDGGKIIAEARAAREQGADLVIAVLHFGVEYARTPNAQQRQLVETICAGGVDVVIGAHPHVVQPIDRITVQRNGVPHDCVVAYSLGNFISNQRDRYRDSGIILYLDIEKSAAGTSVAAVRYLPVWVQKSAQGGRTRFRVLPVHPKITPATDIPLSAGDRARMTQVWQELTTQVTRKALDIVPASPTLVGEKDL